MHVGVLTSEVVAAGQEVADRHEVEQHDREPDRRQVRGALAAPAERAARTARTCRRAQQTAAPRIFGSAIDIAWTRGSTIGPPFACAAQMVPTITPTVRKSQPTVTVRRVHQVERIERRQARVEEAEVLRLDLLEQQHVGDPDHARQREAGVREQQRRDVHAEPAGSRGSAPAARRTGFSARMNLQRDQQRDDEDAQRALLGRHLHVEIREREQPDERRDRLRRPGDRHVPRLHRLHPDDEGVREGARRRGAAVAERPTVARRVAKCTAYSTPATRYSTSGNAFAFTQSDPPGRAEATVASSCPVTSARSTPAWSAPSRPRGPRARRSAATRRRAWRSSTRSRAGTGSPVRRRSGRRRRPGPRSASGKNARPPVSCASCRSTKSASLNPFASSSSLRPQADRVDRRLRPLGQVEHLVVGDQARRVLAVRQHDDRLAADVLLARRADLLQFLERDVDRVVERRRARRRSSGGSPARARRGRW